MPLDTDVELLRGVPFFDGFSSEHLRLIAFSSESRTLPENLLLFDEGQALHSAYVVASGALRGERRAKRGEGTAKRAIGPGAILGEQALIVDARAKESVRVESRARVLQVRKATFRRLLEEYPQTALTLRARLARSVLQVSAELDGVARRLAAIDL